MGVFSVFRRKEPEAKPFVGKVRSGGNHESDPHIPTHIGGYKQRTKDLLRELRCEQDAYRAIELITQKHPDASMARQSYVRLANTGHHMEIYHEGGTERNSEAEAMWRKFCARVTPTNTKGLDGIIDQCHDSLICFGGYGMEVTVADDLSGISGVHPILPQWLKWENDKSGDWFAFQRQGNRMVNLTKDTNFFWMALDNEVGRPTGRLAMESSLVPIENQLEFFENVSMVLYRAGLPRNDVSIDREAFLAALDAGIRNNEKLRGEAADRYIDEISRLWESIGPENDLIHFDDVKVSKSGGDSSRSIDIRAHYESMDPQVINGFGTPSILLNRTAGITETWGSVHLKIFFSVLESMRQNSKRGVESVCNFWLQVVGIKGSCKFEHNPSDWRTELDKKTVQLKNTEISRKHEEYGWINRETAAKDGAGTSKENLPTDPPPARTEYIKHSFNVNTDTNGGNDD